LTTSFYNTVCSYDTSKYSAVVVDKLTSRQIKIVKDKYLDGNADLTVEAVNRSSKACGPLYQWAESQVKYSSIYNSIQPLREEVEQLEKDAKVANDEKEKLESEVAQLESSIANYKAEYATLIRDVEALKHEMEVVTTKVDRAESLMTSLSHESERWSKSSEGFQSVLRNLVGDGLQSAAFLTYSGFFPFNTRRQLLKLWRNALDLLGIEFREDLGMVESLSKASDRLQWQSHGLPGDSLSLENGVILDHCVRFPLIIDPSGHAIDFVMNKYKDQKIQKTSFLDKAFMKTLAGAVRFGTTLLVENVEKLDPVLNPILNKEIQRTGGRSLVRIGTEEVDYSPKFSIILTTKNPAVRLTPDLCSRVTLVNFTVTPAGLQSQSLSRILECEKPEIEKQRNEILKLQGEQNVKLRGLEEQMLKQISAVEGSILDNDLVVEGMERMMKEGAQVEEQIAKSTEVMAEVDRAISKFEPFSLICKELFVLFAGMREISFLYEFTAKSFMAMLECVLKGDNHASDDEQQRLALLRTALFGEVAARVGRGLKTEDKMVFALLLSKISSGKNALEKKEIGTTDDVNSIIDETFGVEFPWQGKGLNDLRDITFNDINSTVPLLLVSAPGHDVSGRVEAMAKSESKELTSVAMGSAEGYKTAENFIASASKRGTWVMIKNCHLCTDWLEDTLVKILQSLSAGTHRDFRMFITSEISPKLPTALLQISDIIVAEAPTGIKASISRFFSSISNDRFGSPVQNRLYLLLGWTHSVIQERLRFMPHGWTEQYEFTEADAIHALDVIDSLVSDACGAKQNLDPEKLPWEAIRTTLCKGVFGGRVTNDKDQEVLDMLVKKVFVPEAFNVDFQLVDVDGSPVLPEATSKDECFAWINSLPSHNPPTWIGLDATAEAARDKMVAESVVKKYGIVSDSLSDE
jgi:dynein heavy chain 1